MRIVPSTEFHPGYCQSATVDTDGNYFFYDYTGLIEWDPATNYAVGARVLRNNATVGKCIHNVYECLAAGVDATAPEDSPLRWVYVIPTNAYACLNNSNSDRTMIMQHQSYPATFVIPVNGPFNCIFLNGILNWPWRQEWNSTWVTSSALVDITIRSYLSSWTTVYTATNQLVQLNKSYLLFNIGSVCEGAFANRENQWMEVTITLKWSLDCSGLLSFTNLGVGMLYDVGVVQKGLDVSYKSYSTKDYGTFGVPTIVKRKGSYIKEYQLKIENSKLHNILGYIDFIDARPALFLGDEISTEPVVDENVFGLLEDFSVIKKYKTHSDATLSVQALI